MEPRSYTNELAEEAAKSFNKAMKGIGTDEKRLISEITKHTNSQRQMIKDKYMTLYGKRLMEDISSETSGNFEKAMVALLEQTDEYEAKAIRKAIEGFGTNERVIIQILCPKEPHEIHVLRDTYSKLFQRDLEKDLSSEQGSHLGRIFRSIISAGRSVSRAVDMALAIKEAQELYDAGEGKFGTDESEFIRILCSRSFQQLSATFDCYIKISGNDIEKVIKKEMGGNLEDACLAIVRSARNKYAYFAHEIHAAMAGAGTRDDDFIRLIVSKSEWNMQEIKSQFFMLYGKSLYDRVKSELSGDYEKLMLQVIGK